MNPPIMIRDPAESKQSLRRRMRHRRMGLSIHHQFLSGLALARRLGSLRVLAGEGLLLGTLPHRGEIDARPFLQSWLESGRPLSLPRVADSGADLELRAVNQLDQTIMGYQGIAEPDPEMTRVVFPHNVTFLLIPGLAFDLLGNRLGQGGGHYDRLLDLIGNSAIRIGIVHDFQILSRMRCVEDHDHGVDFLVSPLRVIHCRQCRG